ncbi:medium-chain acyl-CoA ligase ACSF2, mitochondrial-like [Amphiura filiformis]|uniref:medium-chain acyl-CoA ligase ACSF2, mitochondrial-like n=1 Tax=Amphiura filiformis TaxID=82378 RepID=UPI003B224DD9
MANVNRTMSYIHVPRKVPFTNRTIGQQLYYVAEKYSDKEMYVFYGDNERISFQQMKDRSQQFAASLLSKGMKKGDRMALWGFNHSEWLVAFYACTQLGILAVPLRLEFPLQTVSSLLKKLKCKAMLLTHSPAHLVESLYQLMPELNDGAQEAGQQFSSFPDLDFIIYGDELSFEHVKNRSIYKLGSFLDLADKTDIDKVATSCMSIDMDDPAIAYFTSGTTGIPKPSVLSHHAMVNNAATAGAYRAGVEGFQDNWDSVRYATTVSFSGSGSFIGTFLPLVRGCTTVILYADFTVEAMAKALQDEKVTEGLFFINHMAQLINFPDFNKYDFSNLKIVILGGSVIPYKLRQSVEQKITKTRTTAYGMTEVLATMFNHPLDPQDVIDGDCVYPVGGIEVKIVNKEGKVVPVNTQGEMLIRSYSLFLYYWGEPEKTREFKDNNGWAHTGDVAEMDHRGFIKICGRIKELIIKNAVNLAPPELERVLNQHPGIVDSMVVGVPDDIAGEEVCACVRLEKAAKPSTDEIIEFCKGKVLTLLVPKYVVFVDEFPATETGKFSRKKMSTRAMEMLGLKQET